MINLKIYNKLCTQHFLYNILKLLSLFKLFKYSQKLTEKKIKKKIEGSYIGKTLRYLDLRSFDVFEFKKQKKNNLQFYISKK